MDNINLNTDVSGALTVQNPIDDIRVDKLPQFANRILQQSIRTIGVTIQILVEETDEVVANISGMTHSGSIKADSTSLIRRVLSLTMTADDNTFPSEKSINWYGMKARVYFGIDDLTKKDETVNFLVGTFIVSELNYSIEGDTETVDATFEDMMTKYEDRQLENPIVISPDTPISVAMRLVMENIGEKQFGYMEESTDKEVVPYTLEYGIGDNVMEIIEELRDMYMDYICGYDVQGKFEFRKVQQQSLDAIDEPKWKFDIEDDSIKSMVSFKENYNLKDVRNRVVTYGETSARTGITPQGEARITDLDSPFNVYAIGERTYIDVKDKYVVNEQCIANSKFEVLKRASFNEVATIETIPIYTIDLNDVILVRHPRTRKENYYMVDDFSYNFSEESTMSITAHRMYFATVEYGEEKKPLVNAIKVGIINNGWLSLGEEAIQLGYNIVGNGSRLNVVFQDVIYGGEQASVTSYPTTTVQTFAIDLADFRDLDFKNPNGGYLDGSNRSKGDYADRVFAHEMMHAVTNSYLGYEKSIVLPVWFEEGTAEFLHGVKDRFLTVFNGETNANKKTELIKLAEYLLSNNFSGTSEDYVASALIVMALYKLLPKTQWMEMFNNLRKSSNIGLNFLNKLAPSLGTNEQIKTKIINMLKSGMNSTWTALFDVNDKDTMSVLGKHFMAHYGSGVDLTAESVFNNGKSMPTSIGFDVQFIK